MVSNQRAPKLLGIGKALSSTAWIMDNMDEEEERYRTRKGVNILLTMASSAEGRLEWYFEVSLAYQLHFECIARLPIFKSFVPGIPVFVVIGILSLVELLFGHWIVPTAICLIGNFSFSFNNIIRFIRTKVQIPRQRRNVCFYCWYQRMLRDYQLFFP